MEAKERFLGKIRQPSGCWLWMGGMYPKTGYGQFWLDGKTIGAHRAAWLLFRGPIPSETCVLHRCDVRACVNPDHLFLGTIQDNMKDRDSKGRHWTPSGERHYAAKLTAKQAEEIRRRWPKEGSKVLASEYGVKMGYIWRVATGHARANG